MSKNVEVKALSEELDLAKKEISSLLYAREKYINLQEKYSKLLESHTKLGEKALRRSEKEIGLEFEVEKLREEQEKYLDIIRMLQDEIKTLKKNNEGGNDERF